MNEVGTLAQNISDYSFPDDTGKFPVSFISGWINFNIGKLNAVTHECFVITDGTFGPTGLSDIEENIFAELFTINYYNRASRDILVRSVYNVDGSVATSAGWNTLREGDTYISRPDRNSVSRSYIEMVKMSQERLDSLLYQYNNSKAVPGQVVGDDGDVNYYGLNNYNRDS